MLYIFDEGKFVAKLNAQGRGYGEKFDISSFTYSEVDRTLYVSTYEKSSNQGVTGLQFFWCSVHRTPWDSGRWPGDQSDSIKASFYVNFDKIQIFTL